MEGDVTTGYDVAGGLEQTPSLPKQNYRPGWSTTFIAKNVNNARPAYFKFFRQPGNGSVAKADTNFISTGEAGESPPASRKKDS